MFHSIFAILSILIAWKWGDWRNWRLYYPTILFVMFGDLIQMIITYNYPLWTYNSSFTSHTIINLIVIFTVFPSFVILFIPRHPKNGIIKKGLYMLSLALLFTLIEWFSYLTRSFSYYHNWYIWYSLVFNIILVSLIRIHYNDPRLAIPLACTLGFGIVVLFKIPLSSIK